MKEITLDDLEIKDLLKAAIFELFQENKELITKLLSEMLEDIAIEKAIIEGENSGIASRDEIFEILNFQT